MFANYCFLAVNSLSQLFFEPVSKNIIYFKREPEKLLGITNLDPTAQFSAVNTVIDRVATTQSGSALKSLCTACLLEFWNLHSLFTFFQLFLSAVLLWLLHSTTYSPRSLLWQFTSSTFFISRRHNFFVFFF